MHQLLEDVLPYFVAFYVLDSLAFVAAGEVVFARRLREFQAHGPGPVLAGLLPVAEVLSALDLPFRLSPRAVLFFSPGGLAAVSWEALGVVTREERSLRVAGHALRTPSPEAARYLATLLVRLRDCPRGRRTVELQAVFRERADVGAFAGLYACTSRFARPLEILGFVLLGGSFGLIPLGLATRSALAPDPAWVLLALAPVYAAIMVLAWRTLRGCGLSRGACLSTLGTLLFFPPAAAHVRSLLPRRVFSAFDPMVLAAALLPPAAFRAFARERFHRLRLEGQETDLEAHAALSEEAWRRAVDAAGQTVDAVLEPPDTDDPQASAYCPLCSTEYRPGFPACSECRVPLLPFRGQDPIGSPAAAGSRPG